MGLPVSCMEPEAGKVEMALTSYLILSLDQLPDRTFRSTPYSFTKLKRVSGSMLSIGTYSSVI